MNIYLLTYVLTIVLVPFSLCTFTMKVYNSVRCNENYNHPVLNPGLSDVDVLSHGPSDLNKNQTAQNF